MSTPPERGLASRGWRLQHSLWLTIPILGIGCASGVGLIYVGVRMGRPPTWLAGIGYTVVGVASWSLFGANDPESVIANVSLGVMILTWLVTILHSGVINRDWLRFLGGQTPWYAPAPPPLPAGGFLPSVSEYYGPGAAATGPTTTAGSSTVDSVDVNAAPVSRLATLPGFDEVRASAVIAEREARGGFSDMGEFAAVAGLAPHELVRLRPLVTCSPRPSAVRYPIDPPGGRVLDV